MVLSTLVLRSHRPTAPVTWAISGDSADVDTLSRWAKEFDVEIRRSPAKVPTPPGAVGGRWRTAMFVRFRDIHGVAHAHKSDDLVHVENDTFFLGDPSHYLGRINQSRRYAIGLNRERPPEPNAGWLHPDEYHCNEAVVYMPGTIEARAVSMMVVSTLYAATFGGFGAEDIGALSGRLNQWGEGRVTSEEVHETIARMVPDRVARLPLVPWVPMSDPSEEGNDIERLGVVHMSRWSAKFAREYGGECKWALAEDQVFARAIMAAGRHWPELVRTLPRLSDCLAVGKMRQSTSYTA